MKQQLSSKWMYNFSRTDRDIEGSTNTYAPHPIGWHAMHEDKIARYSMLSVIMKIGAFASRTSEKDRDFSNSNLAIEIIAQHMTVSNRFFHYLFTNYHNCLCRLTFAANAMLFFSHFVFCVCALLLRLCPLCMHCRHILFAF